MNPNAIASQIATLDKSYNPVDTYNTITTKLGIPDARTRVTALQTQLANTESALDNVDSNVTGRTSGALVTEAQRGRLVNEEKAPIQDTYTKLGADYGTAQQNENQLEGEAQTQANLAQSDFTNKQQSLATQLAAAQKAQEDAATKAEADRQYTLKQQEDAQAASAAAAARSASAAAAAKGQLQEANSGMASELQKVVGGDGYVSPGSYAAAKKAYTALGYSASQFDSTFAGYRNPKNKYYKLG